ncbi:hypothetical protein PFLUV_G00184700 [Perca fluviatilis]|uniref:EGF-like domain-containing protein n=1 Tax=Perca fluviatilis TaxID=8168 RepID=A0A6A5F055_PERFL|nr:uncharacterized protein LOC120575331 [Perca fluviatilis]KAF1380232.1 hypothetical protein PFLUV_G00184700 [Perca fluviatilis]
MVFPRLLASLILLLYWTTSSAESHDPTSSVISPSYRVKRDQPFENREKWEKSLAALSAAKEVLPLIKKGIEKIDIKKLTAVMNSLANIASLAPGIGSLIFSVVNMVLIFIPQDDPVLNEVKKGFAEVNRKLDSISIQISNLATDVEWYNYASVYSQDELRILNAWKKFNDLLQNSQLVTNEDQKLRLAEIFTNYYENTGTEASVANFYHYLTVNDTSLSGNLNVLLRKKFKCDFQEIGKYNVYFSRLLWQGMVLNQFYWKLIGLDSSGIEAKHTKMFNDVYAAQKSALEAECLDNYEHYLEEDVMEISKGLSADNTTAIAVQVKEFLDNKYFWYNWVVMVYTDEHTKHKLFNMIKIPVGTITVNVGYTLKAEEINMQEVTDKLVKCHNDMWKYSMKACDQISFNIKTCDHYGEHFRQYVKVMHASIQNDFVQVPKALEVSDKLDCTLSEYSVFSHHKLYVYYSRNISPCHEDTCENGKCRRLLNSNEYLCECPPSYHGDRCEKEIENQTVPAIIKGQTVPDITTINAKLKRF